MDKWDENSASEALNNVGTEVDILWRRIKIPKGGLTGLKGCSALDFLVNHKSYRALKLTK
jgi:hypothetical protein